GYIMLQKETNFSTDGNIAKASGSLVQKGNKICVERKISLGKRVYEASEWEEFRTAVNAYKDISKILVFEKK
ncbi:MAG: transglutaminase, partial [Bacteroidaceae bacterium]|nr:transglutaminase [Bacteroidaceae bacterium]